MPLLTQGSPNLWVQQREINESQIRVGLQLNESIDGLLGALVLLGGEVRRLRREFEEMKR